jgi:hypothetical protein
MDTHAQKERQSVLGVGDGVAEGEVIPLMAGADVDELALEAATATHRKQNRRN